MGWGHFKWLFFQEKGKRQEEKSLENSSNEKRGLGKEQIFDGGDRISA